MAYNDRNKDFKCFCNQLIFDLQLNNYKNQLVDWNKLNDTLILKNQFFYINDFELAKNIYVHPNAEIVTGYPISFFEELGNIYSLIHPEDRDFVFDFSKRTISISYEYKELLKENPLVVTYMIDFRLKTANGQYIRLNRQTCCFKTDNEGNMVYALVVFTDITQVKKSNSISFSLQGDQKYSHLFKDLIEKYNLNFSITKREKDVLTMLSKGYSAPKIAKALFVSTHTIITHRKHLLIKTGTKNTAELIKFAVEKNLI
ncbi:MAG: LuxR C-terminal-related transcriptional regulator [Bacteroidales bacterium]